MGNCSLSIENSLLLLPIRISELMNKIETWVKGEGVEEDGYNWFTQLVGPVKNETASCNTGKDKL